MTAILYDVNDFLSADIAEEDGQEDFDFPISEDFDEEFGELSEEDLDAVHKMQVASYLGYDADLMEDDLE